MIKNSCRRFALAKCRSEHEALHHALGTRSVNALLALRPADPVEPRPYLFVFPLIGAAAAIVLAGSIRARRDGAPFIMVSLMFAAAFATLAVSFWPYMIPFTVTIDEAAASHSSLAFTFWGEGLFVFPLMLIYTVVSYGVFRGKVKPTADY